ncbi:N(6)-L-threonylcarbamoyladenine synthase, TsaE subunit [Gammaproteobacteria bacterium]
MLLIVQETSVMEAIGGALAKASEGNQLTVALIGVLGVGKTTFSRGFLRARGYVGIVRSPTFTLVESYDLPFGSIYHFDLYRLTDPEELEWLGVRDYFSPEATLLIEWPERGVGILPNPDLCVEIKYCEKGRRVTCEAETLHGVAVLESLERIVSLRKLLEFA